MNIDYLLGAILAVFLGPIGFIIALCVGNRECQKSATVSMIIYVITAFVIVAIAIALTKSC